MTSFYMFRLWFKTFFGPERFDEHAPRRHRRPRRTIRHRPARAEHDAGQAAHHHGVHESPWIMLVPLVILAILSVIGGWVGVPAALGGHNEIEHFLDPVFASTAALHGAAAVNADQVSHSLELGLAAISVLVALLGLGVAYLFYYRKPGTAAAIARRAPALYSPRRQQVLRRRDLPHRHRHPAPRRSPASSSSASSTAASSTAPATGRRRHPRPRQRSPAASSPETSAPTPAGSPSEPPPSSPS